MPTQITPNFALEEFAVSHAHPDLVEPVPADLRPNVERLAKEILQPLRNPWGCEIEVLSGYRSKKLNKAVGGSATSQHVRAEAADVTTADVEALFYAVISHPERYPCGQVIFYPRQRFIHVALPSKRYSKPSFFVSPSSKVYTRVHSLKEAAQAVNAAQ